MPRLYDSRKRILVTGGAGFLAETGSTSTLVSEPLPQDDPKQRQPDISVVKAQLGWTPTGALREGLKATTECFRGLISEEA